MFASLLNSENSTRAESTRTAESIAIGLLHAFSDLRRVTASEFNWLISEEDVPQKVCDTPWKYMFASLVNFLWVKLWIIFLWM